MNLPNGLSGSDLRHMGLVYDPPERQYCMERTCMVRKNRLDLNLCGICGERFCDAHVEELEPDFLVCAGCRVCGCGKVATHLTKGGDPECEECK